MERVCETPAGKASPGETPQAQRRRGGSRTARGKRVPVEEINVQIVQTAKNCRKHDFHRVCLQSKGLALICSYHFLNSARLKKGRISLSGLLYLTYMFVILGFQVIYHLLFLVGIMKAVKIKGKVVKKERIFIIESIRI